MKSLLLVASALALLAGTGVRAQLVIDDDNVNEDLLEFEHADLQPTQAADYANWTHDLSGSGPSRGSGSGLTVLNGFEGISQYQVATYGRNFFPPDTMGAVGNTQYTSFVNGGFAVFSKATGAVVKATSDLAFWTAAGQTGASGDSRVMYNAAANRWIALSFGASVADIQFAVSNTSDAAGTWKSVKATFFAGGTADYPTLAMDNNAVYVGTNNFNANGSFGGVSLNVIPLSSLINATAPTLTGLTRFTTPYVAGGNNFDGGYAIQGVNSSAAGTTGKVIALSLAAAGDTVTYDIQNAGSGSPTASNFTYLGAAGYQGNGAGRQPNAVPDVDINTLDTITSNNRVVDTLDARFGSSVYEQNGRIYAVHTVTPTGSDFTVLRYQVIDKATNTILSEGDIGDATHDYYQGSLSVNKYGQVVFGYNRSGRDAADGKITFAARLFDTTVAGALVQRGPEQVLKVSLVDDYHNNSSFGTPPVTCGLDGQVACGRQRWGDYSAVSLDPTDDRTFWVIGEYAREYNNAAGGHPGGTGRSRWSTWISQIAVGNIVPEPGTWALMIAGFGLVGVQSRRRRSGYTTA